MARFLRDLGIALVIAALAAIKVGIGIAIIIGLLLIVLAAIYEEYRKNSRNAPTRKPIAIDFVTAESRADGAVVAGFQLAEQLKSASDIAEIAALHPEMRAWDDRTYAALEPFSAHWAITFGDNVFDEAPPTDRKHLTMLLSAKLARLHTLLNRDYDPIFNDQETAVEEVAAAPSPEPSPESVPEGTPVHPDVLALRVSLNRLNIGKQLDQEESRRLRRDLMRQGYALLARLEADALTAMKDLMTLPRDLRVWARSARGYIRAELPHRQERLPDDEPLNTGDTYAKVGLVNAYLELLRF